MSDLAWINAAISTARPQAVGALLRYFRDLDTAEEAFQDACLRALKNWPRNGPPRDPTAWLIMVGRNAALDGQLVLHGRQALHHGGVLFLGPGADHVFGVVAEDGVEHRDLVLA